MPTPEPGRKAGCLRGSARRTTGSSRAGAVLAECLDGALGPLEAGPVDGQPVVDGKARVAVGEAGDSAVFLKLGGQRRERVREVLQEHEHLVWREQVFHHHETHEVQAEVTRDRGRFHRGAARFRAVAVQGLN